MGTFSNLKKETGTVFCFMCDVRAKKASVCRDEIPDAYKKIRNVDVIVRGEKPLIYVYAHDVSDARERSMKKLIIYSGMESSEAAA